jgi:hypothetical protein
MSQSASRNKLLTLAVLVVGLGVVGGGIWYVSTGSGQPSKKEADAAAREAKLLQQSLKDAPPPPLADIPVPDEPVKGRGPMVKPK